MAASVGRPPSISHAGARAWVTPCSQDRQAYFGRIVTITRSCAGTMSRRSVRSLEMALEAGRHENDNAARLDVKVVPPHRSHESPI